jgi:hypothetical protein
MSDDEATGRYATYAEMDLEKASEFREGAASLHHEAENVLGLEGEKLEAKADDLDRRAWLLEDAAGLWREAGDDERRSAEARTRAEAAFETAFDLRQRINDGPLTDDEITQLRVEAARAAGEQTALQQRTEELAHQAGFDIKLAETEEAAAQAGIVRPAPPQGPEHQPNPDLLPPE